jgi:hypothetical protein
MTATAAHQPAPRPALYAANPHVRIMKRGQKPAGSK